jgi:hypothetical protein
MASAGLNGKIADGLRRVTQGSQSGGAKFGKDRKCTMNASECLTGRRDTRIAPT